MLALTILKPGIQMTVQDLGSHTAVLAGLACGGAADPLALQLANWLLGNPADAPALEITLGNACLRAEADVWLALCGAPCRLQVEGRDYAWSRSFLLRAGQVLEIGRPEAGLRSYLAVAGGFAIAPFLGSFSTRLQAGCGGWQGRALRAGDTLPVCRGKAVCGSLGVRPPAMRDWVRVLRGPQWECLSPAAQLQFQQATWHAASSSNRMGARLQGPALELDRACSLHSHAVLPGTIQLPPDGAPIVLLADAQLTGGYPVIGQVIAADVWRCGQWLPGQSLRFVLVSHDEAIAALQQQRAWLERIRYALGVRLCP